MDAAATLGVSRALESRESLSAAAEGCDGPTLGRLLLNVEHIITQICSSISGVTEAVEQSVCTFSTIARRRLRSRDKLFESQIDELSDTCKMLETLVHQFASLSMPHSGMDSLLDSICSANEMLTNTDRLNAHSALSSYLETIPHLHSRIQTAVDPARSVVTHPHWLSREEVNLVRINVLDCGGAPVFRLDPMDVNCSVIIHTSSGSEAAPIIQASRIRYNTVTVSVIVPPSCTMHSCMLSINFTGSSMQLPMKIAVTKAVEAECLAECRRVRALGTIQAHAREDVDCLVSAAHRTVSSPTVAQHFATVIAGMCSNNYKNRVACLVAGVIGSLIELLHAHGVYSYRVGEEGCRALGTLASYYPAGADRIASLGGIEAIVIVMASHPMTRAVQGKTCRALYQISYSSPATLEVMRSNCRLGELALAAARNHPMDSDRLDSSHHCYSITELLIRVKLGLSATGC